MKDIYIIRGKVRHGNKRGRKLGYPTANIDLHQVIPEGVYASKVKYQQRELLAVTFIGKAKTYNETKYQSESYLFDFNDAIYDKWLSIRLLKKLRGNQKFESEEDLIKQMREDVKQAKGILG